MEPVTAGYLREGRRYVTLAVGCTGGKHRSVAVAEALRDPAEQRRRRRPSSSTATWGRSEPAVTGPARGYARRPRSSPSAAATAWPPRSRRSSWSPTTSPPSSRSPTTAARPGRLRDEFDVLPPGDLRMALTALCDDTEWGHTWRDVLQHRFRGDGPLGGPRPRQPAHHRPLGPARDPVVGLDLVGRLLNARGRVLPMAAVPLEIDGPGPSASTPPTPRPSTTLRGQVAVATTRGTVRQHRPRAAGPAVCPARRWRRSARPTGSSSARARGSPRSCRTSSCPRLRDALHDTTARRLLTLNLEHTGETAGFTAAQDRSRPSSTTPPDCGSTSSWPTPACVDDEAGLRAAAARLGAELVSRTGRRNAAHRGHHDSLRLAAAYRDLFG